MWVKLKSLFLNKTNQRSSYFDILSENDVRKTITVLEKNDLDHGNSDSDTLSENDVRKAITVLEKNENDLENEEVIQLLLNNGFEDNKALKLFIFLPIAFVREWFSTVKWPDAYIEWESDKIQTEKCYDETKDYIIIWKVTKQYFENSPKHDTIMKIGGSSAEFQAINKLLNAQPGCKLEEIKISKTIIPLLK
jgi:hypothetical protein